MNSTPKAPRAAVIMPAYNAEATIEKTVRSILNQSMGDLLLIAVDDGSTDETAAILERLHEEDPRLLPIWVPNGGPARARNIALEAVPEGTEYLMFSDADDLLAPDALEYAIENGGDADLVLMGYSIVQPDGSENRYFESAALYTPLTLGAALGRLYKVYLRLSGKSGRRRGAAGMQIPLHHAPGGESHHPVLRQKARRVRAGRRAHGGTL